MKQKFKVAISRENVSTSLDIVQACIDLKLDGDMTWSDAVAQLVAEKALQKYQGHIRAAFARVGVELAADEIITVPVLLRVIEQKSGLQVESLSSEGVMAAIDGQLSAQLSARLGVAVPSVMGGVDAIKDALISAAKEAVSSGRATKLITAAMIKKIRTVKTFDGAGITTEEEKRKVMARIYQKRYRRHNREVWE